MHLENRGAGIFLQAWMGSSVLWGKVFFEGNEKRAMELILKRLVWPKSVNKNQALL